MKKIVRVLEKVFYYHTQGLVARWNMFVFKKMQCVKNKDKIMKIEEKKLPKIIECKYHKNSLYDNAQFHCWTTTKFLERSDLKCLPNILYSGACQIKLYQSVTMATAAVNFYFLCYLSLGYRVLFMNTLHLDPKALIQKFAAKWSRALKGHL